MQGDSIVAEHPALILTQLLQKAEPGGTSHTLSDYHSISHWILGK